MIEIKVGDCVDRLKDLEDSSVDAVICDPPYGIKVLDKIWDNIGEGSKQREWHRGWLREAYRTLKPNGVVKAFSSPKTIHHLMCVLGETGFKDLKVEAWVYTGMPLGNYDLAKGIEAHILYGSANSDTFKKLKGVRTKERDGNLKRIHKMRVGHNYRKNESECSNSFILEPQTDEGKRFMGYGTTLKKSWEPICIGVKR